MIIDRLENAGMYEGLKGLDEALKELNKLGANPPVGRHDFDWGYFFVQEGETKAADEGEFEAHRRYIDVQLLLEGEEEVVWQNVKELAVAKEYDPDRDCGMYTGEGLQRNRIFAGMFWVAFPQDAHKPARHTKKPSYYKKAVIKLPFTGKL